MVERGGGIRGGILGFGGGQCFPRAGCPCAGPGLGALMIVNVMVVWRVGGVGAD